MGLTTTDILKIRDSGATATPLYSAPNLQVIGQLHSDNDQIMLTIAFADADNIIVSATQINVEIAELEAIDEAAASAYKTLINTLARYAKTKLLEINSGKTITYTART